MNHKVAIVVGGTGGVGSLVTLGLAEAGHDIALIYHAADDKAVQLKSRIEAAGRRCMVVKADASDPVAVARFVGAARDAFGRIDVLVNTQGCTHELRLLHESPVDDLRRTVDVELMSVLYCCQAVVPTMIHQKQGRIVTIGADAGKVGSSAEAASAAARGGVIALSKGLAREVASYGITVNVVCPGPIETELFQRNSGQGTITAKLSAAMVKATPMKRLARPEEVADMVIYLATGQGSSFVTGQAISISGGLTMC
ncbi:SDR family NAD(P)-dependent oxidoreductase [Denitratisoma oestradiolicum]|uniref:2-hydroxycyclohexane-1-carbonyl-CoA dehydrogenase n=1 Tax=Denitratisoma oestradiolicum TaxID=311182 RepID=A0A6S6YM01_9PROT|nr:SDR family oxidoreductase [Denitratisoma oestradiolicum]TWO81534.1 hypothetical protein CBW56_05380 [Denitratisoma oestradiolicum]CAB1368754.1 2-hydroxycyclohexane-1-carbonyl-CoA dehydrogenase [Denitratisoma oestradiolicum]